MKRLITLFSAVMFLIGFQGQAQNGIDFAMLNNPGLTPMESATVTPVRIGQTSYVLVNGIDENGNTRSIFYRHNNGNPGFSALTTTLRDVSDATATFGEINGTTHLLQIGKDDSGVYHADFYKFDQGSESFTLEPGSPFPAVKNGQVKFVDLNNDDHLDLVEIGQKTSDNQLIAKYYVNDGNGNFSASNAGNFQVEDANNQLVPIGLEGSFDVGPLFDNTQYNDVLMTGKDRNGTFKTYLFKNITQSSGATPEFARNGPGNDIPALKPKGSKVVVVNLKGSENMSTSSDLILYGREANTDTIVVKAYKNDNGGFTGVDFTFTQRKNGDVIAYDIDTDGDNEIIVTGSNGSNKGTDVYRNEGDLAGENGDAFTLVTINSDQPIGITNGGLAAVRNTDDNSSSNSNIKNLIVIGAGSGNTPKAKLYQNATGEPTTYTYENGAWTPSNPNGNTKPDDIIHLINGTATFTNNISVEEVTVDAGATLKVNNVLRFNTLTNHGHIIFRSDEDTDNNSPDISEHGIYGQLGFLRPGTVLTNDGKITVERYMPAGSNGTRGFRFVSSAVTTTSNPANQTAFGHGTKTINDNWQEGVHNTGTNYPTDNKNPNPGYGTHITGSTAGNNGFDATPSGNPSLFTYDNFVPQANAWQPIANTDQITLEAGKPYRLFIRGDRSVNVTDNETTPTNTIIRTTGQLITGSHTVMFDEEKDKYQFVGNPYQSIVDMRKVLQNDSKNINTKFLYYYDPNVGNAYGKYVTVNMEDFNSSSESSDDDRYLQPGQAVFVRTLEENAGDTQAAYTNGVTPEIKFREINKAPLQNRTHGFSFERKTSIQVELMSGGISLDGTRIQFKEGASNAINADDAPKMGNIGENIAIQNGSHYLSIESRAMPTEEDSLVFFMNQFGHTDYTLQVHVKNLDAQTAYLNDKYLDTQTELTNNAFTTVNFSIDEGVPESMASDRFSITFKPVELDNPKVEGQQFAVYPNPVVSGEDVTIQLPKTAIGQNVDVAVYSILGQQVMAKTFTNAQKNLNIGSDKLNSGVYVLKINATGKNYNEKLIIK